MCSGGAEDDPAPARRQGTTSSNGHEAALPLDERPIRELMEDWAKALRTKQIEGVMSHYATNVLSFDLLPPLQYAGAAAHRKHYEE